MQARREGVDVCVCVRACVRACVFVGDGGGGYSIWETIIVSVPCGLSGRYGAEHSDTMKDLQSVADDLASATSLLFRWQTYNTCNLYLHFTGFNHT